MTKHETLRSATGRTLDELDMQAILSGKLTPDDFRISAETLREQALAAEQAGYGQLAENFRRAAELTGISNEQVFHIYTMLRPGRATYDELIALAEGSLALVEDGDFSIVDVGGRDVKFIRFAGRKVSKLDWNLTCGSSTGATSSSTT